MSSSFKFENLGLPDLPLIRSVFDLVRNKECDDARFEKMMLSAAQEAKLFVDLSDVASEEAIAAFLAVFLTYPPAELSTQVIDYAGNIFSYHEIDLIDQEADPVLADIVLVKAASRADYCRSQIEADKVACADMMRVSIIRVQEMIDESVRYSPSARLRAHASDALAKAEDALVVWEASSEGPMGQSGRSGPRFER